MAMVVVDDSWLPKTGADSRPNSVGLIDLRVGGRLGTALHSPDEPSELANSQ